MEIRVDTAEGFAAPKDTFVSMRIGDFQKQSRFDTAKTYKFPKPEDASGLARIEVFQRVGHQTVSLGKLHHSEQSVEVPVNMPGMSFLPMRLGLHTGQEVNTEPKIKKDTKVKTKLDAAQKYLAEHQLEEVIADAMREVIHEKPAEPLIFLSSQILKHAATRKPGLLPRIDGQKEQPPAPPANKKANPSEKLPPISGAGYPAEALLQDGARCAAPVCTERKLSSGSRGCRRLCHDPRFLRGWIAADIGSLREEAARTLINAARDGSLDVALRETRAGQDGAELEELRQQARATLLQGARDGSLTAALQTTKDEDKVEDLRVQARDALLRASINGSLEKALKEGKSDKKPQEDELEELRVQARNALLKGSLDGTLEKALHAGKSEKQPEVAAFKYTPSVGSWLQKKPYQVARPWYYTVHGETEDDKVIKDLQSVIAEKEREIENLKATLKSSGLDLKAPATAATAASAAASAPAATKAEPAATVTSLTPFRPYYAQHLRTLHPDSLQKLYSKFPAVPKPQPKAPEAGAKPAKPTETAEAMKTAPAPTPAAAPATKFAKLPSVGTWLAPNPNKRAPAAQAAAAASPEAPQKFAKMPSVGTWLAPNPEKLQGKESTSSASTGTKETAETATAPASRRPFKQLPSVGTWLAFKPFEEPAKPALSILERSHSKLLGMNKEELISAFESELRKREDEIRKRDEEIAKLKSSNA
ncbi:unnamed protein product [Symbiodinium necroappetens]|uniref:Uncharacterized protein n=1 Tax=Symbiodinium necroappetens TaxID=1628268 RepID=A0A813AMF6_9DINO|nr:unnamed protein product [Symbiodinium necroappetens]